MSIIADSSAKAGGQPVIAGVTERASRRKKTDWTGWLFALPHLILFTVFLLVPVLFGFYISLHRWHVLAKTHPLVGLSNYQAALQDDIFWLALRNTALFVVLAVPIGNLVSLGIALGLSSLKKHNTFYKIAVYLPTIISI